MEYAFGAYRFDPARGLSRDGQPIHLSPKERQLLQVLLEAEGRVVSKEALLGRLWGAEQISDGSLFRAVYRLRKAMPCDDGIDLLATLYRTGVRIAVPVRAVDERRPSAYSALARTARAEAAESLLNAREHFGRRSPADIEAALCALQHALDVDPRYLPAWTMLGEIRLWQAVRALIEPREAGRLALDVVNAALAIDPLYAPGLAIRGWVTAVIDRRLPEGLAEIDRAVAVDPGYWGAPLLRGWVLSALRRHDEAVVAMRRALELNPLGPGNSGMSPWPLMLGGRHREAWDSACALVQRFRTMDAAYQVASFAAAVIGRHDEAIDLGRRAAELAPHTPNLHGGLAYALARAGRSADAREVVRGMEASPLPRASWALAPVHLALGERAKAVELLLDAHERRMPQFAWTIDDPRLSALRGEPSLERAWAGIAERGGAVQESREPA